MTTTQEKALILEILQGDGEQYRYFVERYHQGLTQHLYNLTHDSATAEDLAQEAFIKAYQKLFQYDDTYAFSTWLYKIATNLALRHIKHAKKMQDFDDIEEVLPDRAPTVAERLDQAASRQTVQRAVQTLSPHYRQVISLYYWQECSYEDIATILDKPIGTVRTWLYRAKEQLREELHGQV